MKLGARVLAAVAATLVLSAIWGFVLQFVILPLLPAWLQAWYFWLGATFVATISTLAGIAQLTGYSLRDILSRGRATLLTASTQTESPSSIATQSSSGEQTSHSGSILIVTTTKVEAQGLLQVFSPRANTPWKRKTIGNKTYYPLDIISDVPVFMIQSEMGTATPGGALLTVRQAIQDLQPQAVIMCGIAFGLCPDSQELGDVLIAKQLQCYEPQKVDQRQGHIMRGDRVTASERLLDRFRSGDNDWQGANTHFGLVLSGEKLVDDLSFRSLLQKTEPEAIGGEMEGAGLYVAARDAKVDWILVKAICNWADGKKNDAAQSLAARNAAQFVLHVLQLSRWDWLEQSHNNKQDSSVAQASAVQGVSFGDINISSDGGTIVTRSQVVINQSHQLGDRYEYTDQSDPKGSDRRSNSDSR